MEHDLLPCPGKPFSAHRVRRLALASPLPRPCQPVNVRPSKVAAGGADADDGLATKTMNTLSPGVA